MAFVFRDFCTPYYVPRNSLSRENLSHNCTWIYAFWQVIQALVAPDVRIPSAPLGRGNELAGGEGVSQCSVIVVCCRLNLEDVINSGENSEVVGRCCWRAR